MDISGAGQIFPWFTYLWLLLAGAEVAVVQLGWILKICNSLHHYRRVTPTDGDVSFCEKSRSNPLKRAKLAPKWTSNQALARAH